MTALAEETSLHGVYCWSTKPLCLAVGRRQQFGTGTPLLEELVGPTWSQVALPAPIGSTDSELGRVACIVEATLCSAVGHTVISGATSALLERNF